MWFVPEAHEAGLPVCLPGQASSRMPQEDWQPLEPATMAPATSYPHIEKPEHAPARLERLPRIRVAQIVMDYLAHGWSPDEMCRQYPHLNPAEAHAALAYDFDHQADIDREIEAELTEVEQLEAAAIAPAALTRLRLRGRP
jgi:hypothetical protein